MYENLYFYAILFSGVIGLTLSILLAGLQIDSNEGLQKYNRARWCLAVAFAAFGALNLMEAFLYGPAEEETGSFAGCLAIVIGSLLAMFFTMTVLSFIRPEIVTRKQILAQLGMIVPLGSLLIILQLYAPKPVFRVYFIIMLAAYILLMFLYSRLFVKSYAAFKERMLAFYEEEDLIGQLHWINKTFWLALATGIASLLYFVNNLLVGSALNVIFPICFLLICVFFVNFRPYAIMVDKAVVGKPEAVQIEEDQDVLVNSDLKDKIDTWIERKGFLDNTKSVDEIAEEMGWYHSAIKKYIQETTGEDFRSWRIRLRVEEAKRVMAANPDLPVSRVATMAGFNDRSYFYRTFQKVTGQSVGEYIKTFKKA